MSKAKREVAAAKEFPVSMPTKTRNEKMLGKIGSKPISLAKQFLRHIHGLPVQGMVAD
ncbi:hypothetical protein UFOVP1138_57 [uncultured Caudovirales phage]|uniref:Uncharacterized protein n=1 Tax=uncultured Caudovirales phage TaxID=2100421 RepID=A0A6J5PYP6_9CAUD|nr:hypothetical protein UFOVP975_63 [uncultured Caudovirales phage]CAB4186283.1 hypothetical protein UFOVP1138_57 [uncultured Caudovirales phage]CAB4204434.1 hypothetical protein UFOVP1394_54 [uncultured Caudovirales phage]